MGNITQVAKIILDLNSHVETLFFFVTRLRHYPIVLGHPWLRCHDAIANFEENTLLMAFFFCLAYCCLSPILILAIKAEEEEFYMPAES